MSSFNSMFNCRQFLELHRNYSYLPVENTIFRKQRVYLSLLTYSISFSYPIFLTDYKKILKIAGGLKQLTVPLLSDPNCSIPENNAQCIIPVKCCISFKTMLCPNFLMVWYADIIIFSGFVVMFMYIR